MNALQAEVASLKTSAGTKDELKNALSAMEGQTSAIAQLKKDIISEAGKFVSVVALLDTVILPSSRMTSKLRLTEPFSYVLPLHRLLKAKSVHWPPELTLWL